MAELSMAKARAVANGLAGRIETILRQRRSVPEESDVLLGQAAVSFMLLEYALHLVL